jgi:hypothetical protein
MLKVGIRPSEERDRVVQCVGVHGKTAGTVHSMLHAFSNTVTYGMCCMSGWETDDTAVL